MSLKGYQWLNKKGKVIMSYSFKEYKIDIWQDVSEEEFRKFMEYLKDNGWNTISCDFHNHTCLCKREVLEQIDMYEKKEKLEPNEKEWLERMYKIIEG